MPQINIDPQAVLDGAKEAQLQRVIVIGVTSSGKIYAAASTDSVLHIGDIKKFENQFEDGDFDDPEPDAPLQDGEQREEIS